MRVRFSPSARNSRKTVFNYLMNSYLNIKITTQDVLHIVAFPAAVYLVNLGIVLIDPFWYMKVGADTYLHFFGGLSIGYTVNHILGLVSRNGVITIEKTLLKSLLLISLVTTVAVAWEFHEFLLDFFFQTKSQPSNFDTMKDLFMGLSGGTIFTLSYLYRREK